jgi:hypothetical protein
MAFSVISALEKGSKESVRVVSFIKATAADKHMYSDVFMAVSYF